jgi:tetratricopeptide (TPR) repeat protein
MSLEHQLRAAEGYAELGMQEDALAELDKLSSEDQDKVVTLQTRVNILLQVRQWQQTLQLCERLCAMRPSEAYGFIHAAFCLHELGKTEKAKNLLLAGPSALLDEPVYYYNLGCYDAVLGHLDQALAYLRASFRLNRAFRDVARRDPDLAALQDSL